MHIIRLNIYLGRLSLIIYRKYMISEILFILLVISIGLGIIILGANFLQRSFGDSRLQHTSKKRVYPSIPDHLYNAWEKITPSGDRFIQYRPCKVVFKNGQEYPCVYVMDAQTYINVWGEWPDTGTGKKSLNIDDVTLIEESPFRVPAQFATEIYRSGESGMGYFIFIVLFNDGTSQAYLTGGAIDFIDLPNGKKSSDISAVYPHQGHDSKCKRGREYYWCLFGEGEIRYPIKIEELGIK